MGSCAVCGQGPKQGISIYRTNERGVVPATWACEKHNTVVLEPDFKRLVKDLEYVLPEVSGKK